MPLSLAPQPAAPATPPLQALLDRIDPLSAEIGEGESRRERERDHPFAGVQRFRESGLAGLRIPVALGGPGGSVRDLFGMLLTRLTPDGDRFRLNGIKYYGTGSLYADYLYISANDADGQRVVATIPATRAGVSVVDDWDGMGQRLTASGTITLDNVEVLSSEVAPGGSATLIGRYASSFRQLHLAAAAAGITRAIRDDAVAYVRTHARPIAHSHAETAGGDFFTQKVVGEIAAIARALPLLVLDAADALDRSYRALSTGAADAEERVLDSTLAVAQTQVMVAQLGPRAGELIFDVGGGSAAGRVHNLDRHWRNIRTLISHNPTAYKAKATGDYLLNGETAMLVEGRFL